MQEGNQFFQSQSHPHFNFSIHSECSPDNDIFNIHHSTHHKNQDIIRQLQQIIDLRTTPLNQAIVVIKNQIPVSINCDWEALRKHLIKKKNYLKRIHAKAKVKSSSNSHKQYFVIAQSHQLQDKQKENQIEKKKKRNRQSAQRTRDSQKAKINNLEEINSHLLKESQSIKLENEKLKKQLQEFNNQERKNSVVENKPFSKIISLLIILGVFLMTSFYKNRKENQSYNKFIIYPSIEGDYNHIKFNEEGKRGSPKAVFNEEGDLEEYLISISRKNMTDLQKDQNLLGSQENLNKAMTSLEQMRNQIIIPQRLLQKINGLKRSLS